MTKGEALREAIRRKWGHGGINEFAVRFGKDRNTVRNWMNEKTWPGELEPLFQSTLDLPEKFFFNIGEGIEYEAALTINKELATDPWLLSLKQLALLYAENPENPAIREQIEEWKEHIINQIYLIAKNAPTEKKLTRDELLILAKEVRKRREITNDAKTEAQSPPNKRT